MNKLIKEGSIEFVKIDKEPYKYFSKIEADKILPLLRYINYDLGFKTVSACYGHNRRYPYVNIEMERDELESIVKDYSIEKNKDRIVYKGNITIIYMPKKNWSIFLGLNTLNNNTLNFYEFEYELLRLLSKNRQMKKK